MENMELTLNENKYSNNIYNSISKVNKLTTCKTITIDKEIIKELNQQMEEESDTLRKTYLEIFKVQNTILDDPDWWKRQFIEASTLLTKDIIISETTEQLDKSYLSDNEINIAERDIPGLLKSFKKDIITIGTHPGCDYVFNSNERQHIRASRLHALIIITINKYIVVDMGSYTGIITKLRSSKKDKISSRRGDRNILIFDKSEISILQLGNREIIINPKECIVCVNNPREVIFNCGHFVTCNNCSNKLDSCPICRSPLYIKESLYCCNTNAYPINKK